MPGNSEADLASALNGRINLFSQCFSTKQNNFTLFSPFSFLNRKRVSRLVPSAVSFQQNGKQKKTMAHPSELRFLFKLAER